MDVDAWIAQHANVASSVKSRLSKGQTRVDVVDAYDGLMGSIWVFRARLVGPEGTRAVLARSIQLAARRTPLAKVVAVSQSSAVEVTALREHAREPACEQAEVLDALLQLCLMFLCTLSGLVGDALIMLLLEYLDEHS